MFRTASWGYSINNKLAWVLMEAPVFIVMFWLWGRSGVGFAVPVYLFFLLFQLHYLQRSFVFLFAEREESDADSDYGYGDCVQRPEWNDAGRRFVLFCFRRTVCRRLGLLAEAECVAGSFAVFAGMFINLHSDYVIRHLRKPGDTKHYLPAKGLYRYVTSANYFGELVEWTGFAMLTASPAAWVFVWWTFANLVPRADAIYRHYREEFGDEAVGKRKRIIPYIY